MKTFLTMTLLLLIALLSPVSLAQKGQFITVAEFQARFFASDTPWQTLWIDNRLRAEIELILDHRFTTLRVRYWGEKHRTGWILEEIGKELPITVGVIVNNGKIENVSVLAFRESRGGEIRYPFFTDQFQQAALKMTAPYQLNKPIDGITGATLSVRALKKIATLALFYHQQTPFNQPLATAQGL